MTIITAVSGNLAKGYILNGDLTLTPCYIVKQGNVFAHGDTIEAARRDLEDKLMDDMDDDKRVEAFLECHKSGESYPARDLFEWHHKLTGSCEAGRKAFVRNHGIDLNNDEYTVEEFCRMCKSDYGSEVIALLKERL